MPRDAGILRRGHVACRDSLPESLRDSVRLACSLPELRVRGRPSIGRGLEGGQLLQLVRDGPQGSGEFPRLFYIRNREDHG